MALGDCEHYAELAPKENKVKKKRPPPVRSAINDKSGDRASPLVNHWSGHPHGANCWHQLYDPALCEIVPSLYEGGKSDAEVAVAIGIAKSTLYKWKAAHPEFLAACEYGKSISELLYQEAGREAAVGNRKIDGKVWEIQMRNRFGYDMRKDDSQQNNTDDEQERSIRLAAEQMLKGNEKDV